MQPIVGAFSDRTWFLRGRRKPYLLVGGLLGAASTYAMLELDTLAVATGLSLLTVAVVVAPGSLFLDEHSRNASTMALLRGQSWNYVIFQAQKYSSSGAFSYSTAEAVNLVKLARQGGALPVLFPEWPRRDVPETERIFTLHVSIAQQAPACIAPIGQAWDIAVQRHPNLALYASDGNHSVAAGAQLAALMLYTTVSGKLPSTVPDIAFADVSPDIQRQLRLVADDAVKALSPRKYCPQDLPTL